MKRSVQDGCVLHADPGVPLPVGSEVTIGHNATLHGCAIEDLVLIGMGATVLNGARVGRHSIIAAGTVLAEGQQVPEGVLVAGVPGKVRREVSGAERAAIERNAVSGVSHEHERRRLLSLITGSPGRTFPGGEPGQAGRRLAPGPAAPGAGRGLAGGFRPGAGGRDDEVRR